MWRARRISVLAKNIAAAEEHRRLQQCDFDHLSKNLEGLYKAIGKINEKIDLVNQKLNKAEFHLEELKEDAENLTGYVLEIRQEVAKQKNQYEA